MRIKWGNILAALIGVPVAIVLWTHRDDLAPFFSRIESIGPGHSHEEQTRGLLALGVVVIAIAVAVRIIRSAGHPGRGVR